MKRIGIVIVLLLFICIMLFLGYYLTKEKKITTENNQNMESTSVLEKESSFPEKIDGPIYNKDGSVTIPEGYTACGFYDSETGKIIDSGTTIKVPSDILRGRIHFQQNFPIERTYLLIILVDYMQHQFFVENQSFQSYPFKLEGENEINLNISVNLTETDGKEFSFLIIPEPEEKNFLIDGEYNWDFMFLGRELIANRYILDRLTLQSIEEEEIPQNYIEFQSEWDISGFELVKSRNNLKAFVEGKGGEMLELLILNQDQASEDKNYIILSFSDWQQVAVDGENMKYDVTVKANSSISIPITLPEVEVPTIFQIIAFNNPDSLYDRNAWESLTTFRVLVI